MMVLSAADCVLSGVARCLPAEPRIEDDRRFLANSHRRLAPIYPIFGFPGTGDSDLAP